MCEDCFRLLRGSEKLANVYFNIAAEAIGEDEVRRKRGAMIDEILANDGKGTAILCREQSCPLVEPANAAAQGIIVALCIVIAGAIVVAEVIWRFVL